MDVYDVPEDELPQMEEILPEIPDEETGLDQAWDDPEFVAFVPENGVGDLAAAKGALFTMDEAKKRFANRPKS